MRISDWSSDVCSSDLLDRAFGEVVRQLQRGERRPAAQFGDRLHPRRLPGRRVRQADVGDLAGAHEVIECTQDLVDRRAAVPDVQIQKIDEIRSEENTSEIQSLMRTSYAVFCMQKKHLLLINLHEL